MKNEKNCLHHNHSIRHLIFRRFVLFCLCFFCCRFLMMRRRLCECESYSAETKFVTTFDLQRRIFCNVARAPKNDVCKASVFIFQLNRFKFWIFSQRCQSLHCLIISDKINNGSCCDSILLPNDLLFAYKPGITI